MSPIICDSTYPAFNLSIDIRENDTEEKISEHIENYLRSFISAFFKEIPDIAVQNIMNKKSNGTYSSNCDNSASASRCSKCGIIVSGEQYIYNNAIYCLDCMYEFVVQASVDNNIPNLVGLANMINNTSSYAIVDSREWKRYVIEKYIDAMSSLGVDPKIRHYIMTLS